MCKRPYKNLSTFFAVKNAPAWVHFIGGVLFFLCIYFAPWYVQQKDYKGHTEKASFRSAPIWSTPELRSRETAGLAYGLLLVRLCVAAALWWGLGKVKVSAPSVRLPAVKLPSISERALRIALFVLLAAASFLWGKIWSEHKEAQNARKIGSIIHLK